MNPIERSVKKLEKYCLNTGFETGIAVLKVSHDKGRCQFPKGTILEAEYGGETGYIITDTPLEAKTRLSFLFGAPLNSPKKRAAACAILNAVTRFLCLNRRNHACDRECQKKCFDELKAGITGKKIFLVGDLPPLKYMSGIEIVQQPDDADLLIVGGNGITKDDYIEIINEWAERKRIVYLGPSTSGIAALEKVEHWCPYGW